MSQPVPPDQPPHGPRDSEMGLRLPSARDLGRHLGRALLLRCPNCGGGPVLKNWFKLRVHCGRCGIRTERGEHDYFMGSMMLNYCLTGLIVIVTIFVTAVSRWPDVPWDALQWGLPVAILVLPMILFPWSKLLWLAADISMRPVSAAELERHRTSTSEYDTEYAPK